MRASLAKILSHPWSRLHWRDGKIMRDVPPDSEVPYMVTPEITITTKREAHVAPDGIRTAFGFTLNHAPDAPWRQLFEANLEDRPPGILRSELKVEIECDELTLSCLPAHLERIYAFVKSAIAITNADYQAEKNEIQRRLETDVASAEPAESAEENRIELARQQFKALQL